MQRPPISPQLFDLTTYIVQTMENFTFRYIETATSGPVSVQQVEEKTFHGRSFQGNLKEALKCQEAKARQGIMDFVRGRKGQDRPSVMYLISCEILSHKADSGSGRLRVGATINWHYPEHPQDTDQAVHKYIEVSYEDLVKLRRQFPQALEEVCSIF